MNEVASIRKETVLNQWLDQVSRKQKIDYVFELEMWIKCFDRFFRTKNQPSLDGEVKHFLLKDFREELVVVRDVTLRMSFLANQIMTQERSNLLQFDRYLHNYLKRDYVMDDFCNRPPGSAHTRRFPGAAAGFPGRSPDRSLTSSSSCPR